MFFYNACAERNCTQRARDTAKTAGSVSTNVPGTSALVGVLVPWPFIARVQGAACDRLANQLTAFLRGEDPSVLPGR